MDNISKQLDELIATGETFIITEISPYSRQSRYGSRFEVDRLNDYTQWRSDVNIFIKSNYPNELHEIEISFKFGFSYHESIVSKLKSIKKYLLPSPVEMEDKVQSQKQQLSNKIFIVHGHDENMKLAVTSFITKIKLIPVILNDQVNQGMTIFEKLEANSDVKFAIVLLSPCDFGRSKDSNELKPRARQNVILELGYFIGRLGRENVCVLIKSEVEKPSDIDGIVYIDFDNSEGWKIQLAKELKSAGLSFTFDDIL